VQKELIKKIIVWGSRVFHMFKFSVLIIFLIPLFSVSLEGNFNQPFETCKKSNEDFTKHVANKAREFNPTQLNTDITEADNCISCDNEETLELNEISEITIEMDYIAHRKNNIPYACFLQATIRGNANLPLKRASHCNDENFENKIPTGTKKHCINKSYVDMISKAFSDMSYCFDMDKKDQKDLFHLINHESGFVLNARSHSRARCLGQLTGDFIKEINKIMGRADHKRPHPFSYIYNQAIERCPGLAEKIPLGKSHLTCQATHDPHTCLFYAFYGWKKNYHTMSSALEEPLDYMGNKRSFTKTMKTLLQLPLNLNEILVLEGEVDGKKRSWVMWDDSEIHDMVKKNGWKAKDFRSLKINKVSLFKDSDKVARAFSYWAYNGGYSVAMKTGPIFVEQLKRDIASGCPKDSNQERCLFRNKIKNGESLSSRTALAYFKRQIRRHYPSSSKKRRNEVANYVENIASDSEFLFDESSTQKERYKREFLDNKSKLKHISDEDKEAFMSHVRKVCPQFNFKDNNQGS